MEGTIGAALAAAVERFGDREAFVFDDRRLQVPLDQGKHLVAKARPQPRRV